MAMLKVFLTDLRFTKLVFEILLMQFDGFPRSKEDDSSSYKHHQAPTSSNKLGRRDLQVFVLHSCRRIVLPCEGKELSTCMILAKSIFDIPPRLANFLGGAGSLVLLQKS
jgi:hypothetical protein